MRRTRDAAAAPAAALLSRFPALEGVFVRAGHRVRGRSRLLSALHWTIEDHLVHRIAHGPRRFRPALVGGTRMVIDIADHTGRTLYFHGDPYEPETTRTIQALLGPGDLFLDVGANVGFFSIVAARRAGTAGRVVAFEPHPDCARELLELARVNGVADRVTLVRAAVGARAAAEVPLYVSADTVLSTLDPARSPARAHFAFDRHVIVAAITIDEWMASNSPRGPLTLVKIDVEGSEAEVIEGMAAAIAAYGPAVICETSPGSAADVRLRAAGYDAVPLDLREAGHGNYLYRKGAAPRTLLT